MCTEKVPALAFFAFVAALPCCYNGHSSANLQKRGWTTLRVIIKLFVLGTVVILLSGSLVFTGAQERPSGAVEGEWVIEDFLARQEAELEAYELELKQAGEDLFAQKQGELRRAQAQRFQSEAKVLKATLEAELRALQDELSKEMLGYQLQLMLVSLTPEEQRARLELLSNLQDQMAATQTELEAAYKEQLLQLQAEHEEAARAEILGLKAQVEGVMEEEFAEYRLGSLKELDEEFAKMNSASRSVHANRSY